MSCHRNLCEDQSASHSKHINMGKGRKKARKAKDLAGSESDASMSDGEMREKRKQEQEAQEGEMKTRLERIKSGYTNKQKTLVLSSRGITHRYRHLMMDLLALLPHARKDSKLDTKQKLYVINEIADMKDCSNCVVRALISIFGLPRSRMGHLSSSMF